MKVGTLVNVSEDYDRYFKGYQFRRRGTNQFFLGYVIETFPREEAVKWILRREFHYVFREITGGKFGIVEDDGTPGGVVCEIEEFLLDNVPILTDIHKVMLESGSSGWISEYELREVEDEDE